MRNDRTGLKGLLRSGSAAASLMLALAYSGAAAAQEAAADEGDATDAIVVSGSRIDRKGFDAPTPTTRVLRGPRFAPAPPSAEVCVYW